MCVKCATLCMQTRYKEPNSNLRSLLWTAATSRCHTFLLFQHESEFLLHRAWTFLLLLWPVSIQFEFCLPIQLALVHDSNCRLVGKEIVLVKKLVGQSRVLLVLALQETSILSGLILQTETMNSFTMRFYYNFNGKVIVKYLKTFFNCMQNLTKLFWVIKLAKNILSK